MPPSHGDFAAPAKSLLCPRQKKFYFFLVFLKNPNPPAAGGGIPSVTTCLRQGESFCNQLAGLAFSSLPCEKSTQKGASLPAESPACGKGFFVSPRLRRGETAFPPAAAPAKNHSKRGPSRSLSRLFWKMEGKPKFLRRNRSKNPPGFFYLLPLAEESLKKSPWIFLLTSACGGSARPHRQC